jgi:hypothetical protein
MVSRGIAAALLTVWTFGGQAQQADVKKEVMAVVEGSIKLITEKKYAELIKTYIWPAEVEKLTARFGSVDNAAAEMAKGDSMATVLKALQAAAKLEPGFEGDGSLRASGSTRRSAAIPASNWRSSTDGGISGTESRYMNHDGPRASGSERPANGQSGPAGDAAGSRRAKPSDMKIATCALR